MEKLRKVTAGEYEVMEGVAKGYFLVKSKNRWKMCSDTGYILCSDYSLKNTLVLGEFLIIIEVYENEKTNEYR